MIIAGDVTVVEPVIPKFPDHCKYLLIGAGLASLSAFKAIKTQDPKAKVNNHSLCRHYRMFSNHCQYLLIGGGLASLCLQGH